MIFLHNLKYAFKTLLRNKTSLIWTLLFPIGLATFMNAAFGNLYETGEKFKSIPIAVVKESNHYGFEMMMSQLAADSEDALFSIKTEDPNQAADLLKEEQIDAIVYISDTPHIQVKTESISVSIIKTVLEEYQKYESIIIDMGEKDMAKAITTLARMVIKEQLPYYEEVSNTHGVPNEFYSYFYAVFAMSCLFASFSSAEKIFGLQANESALGMRRSLSSTSKAAILVSEFLSMSIVQFVIELIVLGYFSLLGIHFGDRYPAIILVLLFGSSIGISMGMIVGSLAFIPAGLRNGICVCVSMVLSILADLCVGGLKNTIENTFPIINRLNPAALISDALYALNVYEGYERYTRNIITLAIMAVVMVVISFLILRRNKYASL